MARNFLLRNILLGAALLILGGVGSQARAQNNLLGELYGLGVHAYHAGEYRDAYANLSAAIEGGSRDPRVYYFRGLALSHLGRSDEAQADLEKGAQLEVAGGGDQYPIGKSLERVQGPQRLALERLRKLARIRHQQEQLAEQKKYYDERSAVEEPTLGNQPDPTEAAKAAEELVDPSEPVEGGDPFAEEGDLGAGAAEPAPEPGPADIADETPAAGSDPFGEEPEPAAPAGDDDPFGEEPSAPADPADPFGETEPEPAAPAGDDDPFGGAEPEPEPAPDAGGDPFGGAEPEPEPAPADGADPFGGAEPEPEPAPDAGGDPFGGAEPEPEPAPDAGGDPFGGAEPAAPADADPFGGAEADPGAEEAPFGGAEPAGDGGVVDAVIDGVGDALEAVDEPDDRDPFDNTDEPKTAAPADGGGPLGGEEPAGGDPFGGAEPEPTVPADDPFGAPEPGPEAPAPAEDDPFGGAGAEPAAPAADDPFGGDGAAPEADDPFAAPADAGSDDDPFGAAPASGPEMEEKDDPFADDEPAAADPFGAPATPADGPVDNPPSDDPFAEPAD